MLLNNLISKLRGKRDKPAAQVNGPVTQTGTASQQPVPNAETGAGGSTIPLGQTAGAATKESAAGGQGGTDASAKHVTDQAELKLPRESMAEHFTDASLLELVKRCPKEELHHIYKAGERLRQFVNERWQRGE